MRPRMRKGLDMQMIDWDRLNALIDDVGADTLGEVLAVFIDEMDAEVRQLPAINDATALANALHTLKGTAANLGFVALADLCTDGEDRLRTDDQPPEFPALAHHVRTTYAASRTELLHEIRHRLGVSVQSLTETMD